MKKNTIFTTFICIMALFFVAVFPASGIQAQSKKTNSTVGVWKIVHPKLDTTTIANQKKVKIITERHFIWTHTFENGILQSMGGTCAFDGKTYTEDVQYTTPTLKNYIGKKAVFKVLFYEDGRRMHCVGTVGSQEFNEIWERVE